MAPKKPIRRVAKSEAANTLMGNQDTHNKGDSMSRKKGKCVTFWVTDEQKQAISSYALDHNMTVSRLIIEGLEMRMKMD